MVKWLKSKFSQNWFVRSWRLFSGYNFFLKPLLISQLRDDNLTVKQDPQGPRILVPLIETSHYQFYQVLALAKALQMRGAQVKVLLCGSFLNGCEIKSTRATKVDPCLTCRFNANNILPHFNLDVVELKEVVSPDTLARIRDIADKLSRNYPGKYMYNGHDIIPMTNDSVIRYYYGAVPEAVTDELAGMRKKHLESAMIGLEAASTIYSTWHPTAIVNNMSVYSAWEPYEIFFTGKGVKTNLISLSQFDYKKIQLNWPELYFNNNRFLRWLENRESKALTDAENNELDDFLAGRFTGTAEIFKDLNFFEADSNIQKTLSIDKSKKNIFLFSNIYWDLGMRETASLFDGVISWVLGTIAIARENPHCHLYIKPHPGEFFDSSSSLKGIVDFIFEKYETLPPNVTILYPQMKINTYELFPFIDLALIYNGTLGIELLLNKIPVVVTASAPFAYIDSATRPDTMDDYANLLYGKKEPHIVQINEVRLYAYFYFLKALMPWTLTEKAYGYNFKGFAFEELGELVEGNNKYLDHLCNCIMRPETALIDNW